MLKMQREEKGEDKSVQQYCQSLWASGLQATGHRFRRSAFTA